MTATHVNGNEVVADEPALSPLSTPDKPIYYKQIRQLLLGDGTVLFGCAHCDFTTPVMFRVRPHLRRHADILATVKVDTVDDVMVVLREAIDKQNVGLLTAIERLSGERDEWKSRALKAEKSLATLRKALTE